MSLFQFFNGKRVFITGHTGFKGSWLSFWLNELGAKVTGYALTPDYENSLFESIKLKDKINHIIGDIREYEHLKASLIKSEAEIVFHLAAQALVRRSYKDPLLTFGTNIMGSVNTLEAIRHCPSVRSVVYITSDKCYWNKEWPWGYRENDELGGPDPYSASKASAEHVFRSYYLSFLKDNPRLGCGSVRAGNVIGGGDRSTDRIVPDIIRAIESNKDIVLRNPQSTRPWQHVLDPLHGYLMLSKRLYEDPSNINGHAWNFGPTSHSIRTVFDLTKTLVALWDKQNIVVESNTNVLHEAMLLHLSIDKAQANLNWFPNYAFEDAVLVTGQWYQRVQDGDDPIEVTKQQISDFTNKIEKRRDI